MIPRDEPLELPEERDAREEADAEWEEEQAWLDEIYDDEGEE